MSMKKQNMTSSLLSIVLPIYNEEENIFPVYKRLEAVTRTIPGYTWEYILVNDGSVDRSLDKMKRLASQDKKLKILDLSRNFGKEIALSAGVEAASGAALITLDADLQHPPEIIPEMIRQWENGTDIVATIRRKIKQPLVRKTGSRLFYWLMNKMSSVDMISQTTDFRLIDRKVADIFKNFTEKERMYRGIIDWLGFNKTYVEFDADPRLNGNPGYSYKKLINLAIKGITSFSLLPLKLAGILGTAISFFSGVLLLIMFPTRFIFKSSFFSPLAIVVVINTFLVGIVLICLGIIALYIGSIHGEVINRPLYIVKDKINFDHFKK